MAFQKSVFIWALVATIVIFGLGVFMGFLIENSLSEKISDLNKESEINFLDIRIRDEIFDLVGLDCEKAIEENIKFGDKIYEEALLLVRYEESNKVNNELKLRHKKYDTLRTLFWVNSIKLKKKCPGSFHTIVYVYDYDEPSLEQKAKQKVYSNLLYELKQKKANEIILIPIAGDMNISSLDLLMSQYGVSELPSILVDEKTILTGAVSLEEVEEVLSG